MIPVADQAADMRWLGEIGRWEVWIILASLAALIGMRLLDGRINTHGMLCERPNEVSPARVQLLVVTVVAVCALLMNIGSMRESHRLEFGSSLGVLLFGGSSALFLIRQHFDRRSMT